MNMKEMAELLRWQSQNNNVMPEHEMMQEAAALIEKQGAVVAELTKAAAAVEEWWLSEGMNQQEYGAPYAIFATRAALIAAKTFGERE